MQNDTIKSLNDLAGEYADAKPGDKIVYYTGSLAHDRQTVSKDPDKIAVSNMIGSIANYFYSKYLDGSVRLVQKRTLPIMNEKTGPFVHDYIAVKT